MAKLIEVAIEARADEAKLRAALAKLAAEDPAFEVSTDRESGQIILKGVSELDLDRKINAVRTVHGVDIRVGAPQVAFRERITRTAEVDYTHRKQTGASGEFARVRIAVAPGEPDTGFVFQSKVAAGVVPEQYVAGVRSGIERVLSAGVVAGFPVVDVTVTLFDGSYHDIDSSRQAFEMAARLAFREGLRKAGPELLEPIMKAEVVTPLGYAGAVVGDLKLRRGEVQRQDLHGNTVIIHAMAPLMNMFGYVNNLREISQGRAVFAMQFDHYAPAPQPDDDPPFRPAIGMRG